MTTDSEMWRQIATAIVVSAALAWLARGIVALHRSDDRALAAQLLGSCEGSLRISVVVDGDMRVLTFTCTEKNR